jgi:hypothetical protein
MRSTSELCNSLGLQTEFAPRRQRQRRRFFDEPRPESDQPEEAVGGGVQDNLE